MSDQNPKTFFFILNTGEAVRNFASYGVLDAIKKYGHRCVLFGLKPESMAHFKETLGDQVVFEDFEIPAFGGISGLCQRWITYVWRTRIEYGDVLIRHGGAKKPILHPLQNLTGYLLRPVPSSFWEWVYVRLAKMPQADALFEKYKPALVCISNPVSAHNAMINLAKKRGILTACLLESWDNLTIRGGLYSYPDLLFTWNAMMTEQAVHHHRYPAERVREIGIPSFDVYQRHEIFPTESEWRRQVGIKEGVPVIVYSTSSVMRSSDEFDNIDMLLKARDESRLRKDVHFILRIHPRDDLSLYARYQNREGISLQRADNGADGHNSTLGKILMLAATMRYSTVVTNIFSTIILDAFTQGTPVVAVAYDPSPRVESRSVTRYLRDEHVKKLMDYDSIPVAYSPEEHVEYIRHFLEDPSWKKESRDHCARAHLKYLDGRCSERFAEEIERMLQKA